MKLTIWTMGKGTPKMPENTGQQQTGSHDAADSYLGSVYRRKKPKTKAEQDAAALIAAQQSGQGGSLDGATGGVVVPNSTTTPEVPTTPDPPTPADEPPADSAAEREKLLLAALDDESANDESIGQAFVEFLAAARADIAQRERDAEAARERAAGHELEAQADAQRLRDAIKKGHAEEDRGDSAKRENQKMRDLADRSWGAYSGSVYKRGAKPRQDT